MIVQLTGKVGFPITLDPSVWIFDDRKILFDDAFSPKDDVISTEDDHIKRTANNWDAAVIPDYVRPPVNKSITRFEREKILKHTYVMPLKPFIELAEIDPSAKKVVLHTTLGKQPITIKQFINCLVLFAVKGKPVESDGPVHLYFGDGSNKQTPIKGVSYIEIQ